MSSFINTVALKASLLFLLAFDQSHADEVLTRITERLVKTPMTQGYFQQEKHLKFLRKPLVSTGTFTYHQSQGVIWKTLTPMPSLLLISETRLLSGQSGETMPPAFGSVFKALLGGELKRLTEGFNITGKEQKTAWQLQLIPKDDLLKKIISMIQLSGDTELRQLTLQELNGNLTRIDFTQITHPDHLNSEQQSDFERLSP